MSKFTKMMGTACVLAMAAWMSSPAAAAPIIAPAASAQTGYARLNAPGDDQNIWFLGGVIGGPVGFEGLGVQADIAMAEIWGDNTSSIQWGGGGDAFWGGDMGRFGIDGHGTALHHNGFNHNVSNVGAFGEYYIANFTLAAKGGWMFGTGPNAGVVSCEDLNPPGPGTCTAFDAGGGNGNYLGVAGTAYLMPDLAVSASFGWFDTITRDLLSSPNRFDVRDDIVSIWVEYMFNEDLPLTVGAFFSYDAFKVSGGAEGIPDLSDHNTMWGLRLKYYTGGGSLMDHHRSGLLNDWDKGLDWLTGVPN